MRNILTLILLSAMCLLNSCGNQIKVATVTSEKVPLKQNSFVYENDTVRISYRFWALRGTMTFDIYNKLDVPLYFDWKNSAFITNDRMLSYWQDAVNTEGTVVSSAYSTYYGVSSGSSKVKTKAIHQERIGVIPPRALITNAQYNLMPVKTVLATSGATKLMIPSIKDESKSVSVFGVSYSRDSSPFRFRNYLAYCTNERFDGKVCYLDNDFYVSSVVKASAAKASQLRSPMRFYNSSDNAQLIK